MTRQKINHSMSFEENGNWYCIKCKRIKDDSEDDCKCMYKQPKKGVE